MSEIWEFVSGLGALVGLATGIFVVWDRFFRHSPTAIVIARPLIPGGKVNGTYLQVTNRSDRPILVSWKSGVRDGQFGVAAGDSTLQIAESVLDGHRTVVIEPTSAYDFVLLMPPQYSELDVDSRVEARLLWRYAQPVIWQTDRQIKVSVPKRSLMLMSPDESDFYEQSS
jgi:hypothetical protein